MGRRALLHGARRRSRSARCRSRASRRRRACVTLTDTFPPAPPQGPGRGRVGGRDQPDLGRERRDGSRGLSSCCARRPSTQGIHAGHAGADPRDHVHGQGAGRRAVTSTRSRRSTRTATVSAPSAEQRRQRPRDSRSVECRRPWIASTASQQDGETLLRRRARRRRCAALRGGDIFSGFTVGRADQRRPERRRRCSRRSGRRRSSASGSTTADHAAEVKKPLPAEPLLFIKPSTAVLDPGRADQAAARASAASTTKRSWPSSSAGARIACPRRAPGTTSSG